MNKRVLYIGSGIVFLGLAGIVAVLGRSNLAKTSVAKVQVEDCRFTAPKPLVFDLNETLRLDVTSDKAGVVSIENYNVEQAVAKDEMASITLKTVRSGVFDLKLEGCSDHIMLTVKDKDGQTPQAQSHSESDSDHKADESDSKNTPSAETPVQPNPESAPHNDAVPHD